MANYKYQPLASQSSIWLLTIYPGQWTFKDFDEHGNYEPHTPCPTHLCGSLKTVDLDTTLPSYEALSYVWGVPNLTRSLRIQGRPLLITENLAMALGRIRLEDKPRVVWIDAICIDQQNAQERGHQVKHMAQIYRKAEQVLVDLGWGYEVSKGAEPELAIDLIRKVAHDANERSRHFKAIKKYLQKCDKSRSGNGGRAPHLLEHMNDLAQLEWFHRVWTTQEVGLASKASVFYGFESMPWDDLTGVYRQFKIAMSAHELQNSRVAFRPDQIALLQFSLQATGSFLDVLEQTHFRRASDPRDRVFAILSHPMAQALSGSGVIIEANYDWTLAEVYRKTAIGIIHQTKNLDILSHVSQTMAARRQSPSWVPHWECAKTSNALVEIYKNMQIRSRFVLDTKICLAHLDNQEDPKDLHLQGWSLGLVHKTAGISKRILLANSAVGLAKNLRMPVQIPRTLIDLYKKFRDLCPKHENSFPAAFGSTLSCKRLDPQYHGERGLTKYQADYAVFLAAVLGGSSLKKDLKLLPSVDKDGVKGSYLRFVDASVFASTGRRLFSTTSGYIGLGPDSSKPGDEIFVLHGACVPYVLRLDQSGRYRLVGECHLEGFMGGQRWNIWQKTSEECMTEGWKLRNIVVC
jgi:hypothetical protein